MDASAFATGLRSVKRIGEEFADQLKHSMSEATDGKHLFHSLKTGLIAGGMFEIFNIVDGLSDRIGDFAKRAKELGEFWGAFSVGRVKAVQDLGPRPFQ